MARIVELQGHHPLLLEDGSRVLETVLGPGAHPEAVLLTSITIRSGRCELGPLSIGTER
jgi:hypothetical protein